MGYGTALGGTAVRAVTYVLVSGVYEYQVTLQAAAKRWAAMLPRLQLWRLDFLYYRRIGIVGILRSGR